MHARAYRRQVIARQAQAFTGEKLEDIAGTAHFTDGFGQGLAFFASQQGAQFLLAGEDFAADLVQRIAARLDAGGRPGRERSPCRINGSLDLGDVSLGIFANHIAQVGGVDIGAVFSGCYPLATDVIVETL